jgi:hypothetical protein
MAKKLVVQVTQNDPDFRDIMSNIGAGDVTCKFLWKENLQLGSFDGGQEYPLILFGHAKTTKFINDCKKQLTDDARYITGEKVANILGTAGLKAPTFSFCFLVGCETAGLAEDAGLYVTIGNMLKIPTLGSTTKVTFKAPSGGDCFWVKPDDPGFWRVYYPAEKRAYRLDDAHCAGIKAKLSTYVIRAG